MNKTEQNLISIISPVCNAEAFLAETIKTVQDQTYSNWELILIDDGSQDMSAEIAREYQEKDKRIKLLSMGVNVGAGPSRNRGIQEAGGKYIALLDCDDLWEKEKLQKQIDFMQRNKSSFSFTGYEFANAAGIPNGKKVYVPTTLNYQQALKNTTIWTSTVMFDLGKLAKDDIYMPDVRRGQDTATWWKVLKRIDHADGLNEILSYYRRTNESLSANKAKALKRTWNLYRNVENLSILRSSYSFTWYCFNAIRRRI